MITAEQARELDKSAWVKTLTILEESAVWTAIDYITHVVASDGLEEVIMYEAFLGQKTVRFSEGSDELERKLKALGYQIIHHDASAKAAGFFTISWEK